MDRWQEDSHPLSSKDEPSHGEARPEVQVSIDDGVRIVVDNSSSYAEQLKKSWWTRTSTHRMGGRQFGMAGMLGLMTAVAVVLSYAKWLDFGYGPFFGFVWMIASIFAPFVVFLILIFFPGIARKNRKWVATFVAMAALLPPTVLLMIDPPPGFGRTAELFSIAVGIVLCAWLPQILWLWILFSWRPIRRASAAPPEPSLNDEQHAD